MANLVKVDEQSNGLAPVHHFNITPEVAAQVSGTIKEYTARHQLSTQIQGKQYAQVEAWQYAGLLMGLFPIVREVIDLSEGNVFKYRAEVDIVNSEGKKVGGGVAICSNQESKKRHFEEYAICSMAQTRAIGKGFRMLMAWMFKMADYEPTPAEEMDDPEERPTMPSAPLILSEYKQYALRALDCCQTAKEVNALIKIATQFHQDETFIDKAKAVREQLLNAGH